MLLVDRKERKFRPISSSNFSDQKILERSDLQKMILSSADAFFREMGESLKILGEEIRPSDFIANRIDLLACDPDGNIVIIELKRDRDKYQLLQALSYAGMIAKWEVDELIEQFIDYSHKTAVEAKSEIEDFLDAEDIADLNKSQRIILVAEDFDYEVLVTAEWLSGKFQVDVRCYKLTLAVHGNDSFLSCIRIFPPTELTAQSISPTARNAGRRLEFESPKALIDWIDNPALAEFLRQELNEKWDSRAARRRLRYRSDKKSRIILYVKKGYIYALQVGRFPDDEQFWKTHLTSAADVKVITHGKRVRFRLRTPDDFHQFQEAWKTHVSQVPFSDSDDGAGEEDDTDTEE